MTAAAATAAELEAANAGPVPPEFATSVRARMRARRETSNAAALYADIRAEDWPEALEAAALIYARLVIAETTARGRWLETGRALDGGRRAYDSARAAYENKTTGETK